MGRLIWLFLFLILYLLQYQVPSASSSASSFSFSSSTSTHHLCPRDQMSALLQFKHMFTINSSASWRCDYFGTPPYPKTASWNETSTTNCCLWDGVTCDGLTGHVIGLDLSCSQLYGTIHPNSSSLFRLSHLQQLNLAFNDFNRSHVSSRFGQFASLTHLNLSCSSFSGSIPSEISHLSKLVSLDLSSSKTVLLNFFWDALPTLEAHNFKMILKNLTQLQQLILSEVNISSSVLPGDSLMNLSSLTTLDLGGTGLQGNLPDNIFFHLPKLQHLYLNQNVNLTGAFPKVNKSSGGSSLLRTLDLSGTSLSGELPVDSIGCLKSLNSLRLYNCKFWGSIPSVLGNLTQINELDLSKNRFNGQVPSTLSNLKQLTDLQLTFNNLEGQIPDTLAELVKLEYLEFSYNSFKGQFPSWVANLTQLWFLGTSNNSGLTGPLPSNISGLQNLQVLYSSHSSLNGTIPSWLFTLPSLVDIELNSMLNIKYRS